MPIRRLMRMREIGTVFIRHIIGYFADKSQISAIARRRQKEYLEGVGDVSIPTFYERFRVALEQLGPTFVKLGQIMSTRADVLPREFVNELIKLQENVSPFPFEEVREQIKKNLGAEIEDIFDKFETVPMAAASIGQVHHAFLKSGEEIIVKVQRPGLKAKINADVSIMMRIAELLEKYTSWAKTYNLLERVKEFGRFIREEIDYTIEARYCDTFRTNFTGNAEVYIPKIYWEYTNSKILVMEFVHGIRIRDKEKLDAAGYSKLEVAKTIGRSYAKMILEDGFFHADPHPGNIFVLGDKKIALIDFGMVGRLDKETKGYIAHYFLALVNQDAPALTEILFQLYTLPRDVDKQALKRDVGRLMAKYYGVSLGKVNIADIVNELMEIIFKFKILVPGEFTLFDKTFITLDGIGKELAPDFDLLDEAVPFARQFIQKQFSIEEMAPGLIKDALELKDMVLNLPRQFNKIVRKLEDGDLQFRVEQEKLNEEVRKVSQRVDFISNRLPLGIIAAALFLAGALHYPNDHIIIFWRKTLSELLLIGGGIISGILLLITIRSGLKN